MRMYKLSDIAPRLLLSDRNGYAICKAIDEGLSELRKAKDHIYKSLYDVSSMTESEIDEFASDNGILWYDYGADIEEKRFIAENFISMAMDIGTENAIKRVLKQYYKDSEIKYWYETGGNNFEFIITVDNLKDANTVTASIKKIDTLIPLRCLYNGIGTSNSEKVIIKESDSIGTICTRKCGTFNAGMEAII